MAEAQATKYSNLLGESNKKNSYSKWLIMAAFVVPMVSAIFIFKTGIGMPVDTINRGALVLPATSMTSLPLADENGAFVDLFADEKRWRMLIIANEQCDETCLDRLYLSRQVHIRLGEKAMRVERVFLNTGPALSEKFNTYLATEHPRLKTYQVPSDQWQTLFSQTSIAEDQLNGHQIYYLDQQGYLMMRYSSEHEGADLLTDIKRLLKYSYED